MPRRKRRATDPLPNPPLTLPPPEEESLEDLVERAARIRRTSDALIRQMHELAAEIEAARRRRDEGR